MRCVPVFPKTDSSLKPGFSLVEPVLDLCCYVPVCFCRLCWGTLAFQLLCFILEPAESRGCSPFFCRKSQRVSPPTIADPGSPLFLTPYLERGAIDEGRTPLFSGNHKPVLFERRSSDLLVAFSQETESGWRAARS